MRKLLTATLALCLLAATASAQGSSTGRLVGTVSSSDGVIAGATATVTSNQTGATRTVVTSEDGTYTVPQLEILTYTVKISAPGFKSYSATELKIDTGREYSLDATLEAGDINETVTVTAGADAVNTTNARTEQTRSRSARSSSCRLPTATRSHSSSSSRASLPTARRTRPSTTSALR